MRVTLTVETGPHQGQVFTFSGHEMFLVGRSKRCHFQLDRQDMYFSRAHFVVEANPPLCRLSDLGSRNGTYVNGQRVTETVELNNGDVIKAGHTTLRVAMLADSEPDVTVRPEQTVQPEQTTPTPPPPSLPPMAVPVVAPPQRLLLTDCPACKATLTPGDLLCPACRALADARDQFLPGYQLVRELGKGGMGTVHLGVREADGLPVAIKTVLPAVHGDEAKVQRFLREANVMRNLSHPNIVACYDIGEAGDRLYFAMEYVRGTDLAKRVKQQGPLAVPVAIRLVSQVLTALAHAHARGFVHRDIKPGNILLPEAEEERVKLADFGLARIYQASQLSGLTIGGEIGGTPGYLPPEQITNFRDVSPAADQYSAAAMLYNLLTGRHIFDLKGTGMYAVLQILEDEPVPIRNRKADLPEGLAAVIHRALTREPAQRYPDVQTFCQALAPFAR
jgi:serine/threonine-protein kinase